MIYLDDPNSDYEHGDDPLVKANWLRFLNNEDPIKVRVAENNRILRGPPLMQHRINLLIVQVFFKHRSPTPLASLSPTAEHPDPHLVVVQSKYVKLDLIHAALTAIYHLDAVRFVLICKETFSLFAKQTFSLFANKLLPPYLQNKLEIELCMSQEKRNAAWKIGRTDRRCAAAE